MTNGREKIQTKILTDYLENLYQKYRSENPDAELSLATFRRIRPKYTLTTNYLSRNTCLCTRHQNFSFKLKTQEFQTFATRKILFGKAWILTEKLPDVVSFSSWKRVTVQDGKKKMKIVQEEMAKADFIKLWEKEVNDFSEHVARLRKQFFEIRNLKQTLPEGEVVLHMDFAENYNCKTADEIQSAYWNQSQVTLHPMVLYYRDTTSLQHKSCVAVSDCLTHASSTVLAILEDFFALDFPELRNIKHVHYWTDSPTSQYRNRYMFETIMKHKTLFGCTATWNYFEAGHGKGPCDGVGGTSKRMADEAVNSQRTTIQDADDFFKWAQSSSTKGIHYFFVPKDKCEKKAEEIKACQLQPVKGTMCLHACTGEINRLFTSNTSCYCNDCIHGKLCKTWNLTVSNAQGNTEENTINEQDALQYSVDDFVVAMYSEKWYIGKIIEIDESDNEAEIPLMKRKKIMFQWPNTEDIIWLCLKDILCKIKDPVPSGKSARFYRINGDDLSKIEIV